MSPLPPLPSVRALPLLLLLAVPGAAGEGPGPRGLDVRAVVGGSSRVQGPPSLLEEEAREPRAKAGAGAQSPGLRASPGGLGFRMGCRAPEAGGTGAQER